MLANEALLWGTSTRLKIWLKFVLAVSELLVLELGARRIIRAECNWRDDSSAVVGSVRTL